MICLIVVYFLLLVVYFLSSFEVIMIGLNRIHCFYSLLSTTRTNTWTAPYADFFDAYYQFCEIFQKIVTFVLGHSEERKMGTIFG